MSIKWIASGGVSELPAIVAPDEHFQTFSAITCELTSFEAANGTLYLSAYRLIFLESAQPAKASSRRALKQVILPLHRWISPTIGQPWFGPNYYEGTVRPSPGGGLDAIDATIIKAKFMFKEGGIEHFHKALEVAFTAARERQRNRASGAPEEDLPAYEPSEQGTGIPPTYT